VSKKASPLAILVVTTNTQTAPDDASMTHSTCAVLPLASPFPADLLVLAEKLTAHIQQLQLAITSFRGLPVDPERSAAFEHQVVERIRLLGLDLLEQVYNHLEPEHPEQAPRRIIVDGVGYRRRDKHPNTLATLCGPVRLHRLLYEPLEPGRPCLHPLERSLGVVAGRASAALATRVGRLVAARPQRAVLRALEDDNGISWTHEILRRVAAAWADHLNPHRHPTLVERLLQWLRQANKGRGPFQPVLAVGRDGVHVPMTAGGYNEASVATLTVFDRHGRRLGTVYLGQMPQYQQQTLSEQLTELIHGVLSQWRGQRPRLAYITDGGWHPVDYYRRVLRPMEDPRHAGVRLDWERVIDFYHAAQYVSKLAAALFGNEAMARGWARQMRGLLKQPGGATRVLQSASYYRARVEMTRVEQEAFASAYRYLRRNGRHMKYDRYRREGTPRGSGVTEAGCKTVFAQRLKQSGMRWGVAGGQVVVDLRVLCLSGVYEEVVARYLRQRSQELKGGCPPHAADHMPKAA